MQLKHLKSFLAVAKVLSFRGAAREVGVTQPALSQHVAALEAELGVRLFERNRREVALTPAGEALRDGSIEGLAVIEKASDLAQRLGGVREKTVVVGQLDYISHAFLPNALGSLKKRMPDVLVELVNMTPREAVEGARDGRVDVGFGVGPIDAPELVQREVVRGHWVAWLREDHPLAAKEEIHLSELGKHPIILFRRDLNPLAWDSLMGEFEKAGTPARVALQIAQPQHGIPLVLQGMGAFLVGNYVIPEKVKGAVARKIVGFENDLRIFAVWKGGRRSQALKTFVEGLPRVG